MEVRAPASWPCSLTPANEPTAPPSRALVDASLRFRAPRAAAAPANDNEPLTFNPSAVERHVALRGVVAYAQKLATPGHRDENGLADLRSNWGLLKPLDTAATIGLASKLLNCRHGQPIALSDAEVRTLWVALYETAVDAQDPDKDLMIGIVNSFRFPMQIL